MTGASSSSRRHGTSMRNRAILPPRHARQHGPGAARHRRGHRQSARRPTWSAARATVTGIGTSNVTVNQSTPRAIINWNSFNIGAGETTRFVQPDASSIALNRVTGGLGPSMINGTLTANGRVFLVNPDGVMIGRRGTSTPPASWRRPTTSATPTSWRAGTSSTFRAGRAPRSSTKARINAHSHGFAALVAPGVRNSGTITASYGKIGLASGNRSRSISTATS